MVTDKFLELVTEIKENDKEFTMTPRELLDSFGVYKRTKWNLVRIDKFLEENKLETVPNYTGGWIDGEIVIKHKKKAKSKQENDPIQRIKLLSAANKVPITVSRDAKLNEAITLMMLHNYSQLPVMNSPRNVIGVITWEKIGYGITNGIESENIADSLEKEVAILDYETPILDAVNKIIENEFVLVKKSDNTICGIVTISDISLQFINATEPFLLLEQIENHIRQILDGIFTVEEIKQFCKTDAIGTEIEYIDDLSFGDYIRIIENPDNWECLNLSIERSLFIKQLDKIREIRNDIMHFDPEGITSEQKQDLLNMANFLTEIRRIQLKKNNKINKG
ncbi:MAG: CBS domain-containing protein [Candidatus Delongbacteria bacterium]|nr:CBS domain-containing protein [Candidatus Delongbacteria bacterium]